MHSNIIKMNNHLNNSEIRLKDLELENQHLEDFDILMNLDQLELIAIVMELG